MSAQCPVPFRVGSAVAAALVLPLSLCWAEFDAQFGDAVQPLNQGVPAVAVSRLEMLRQQNLTPAQRRDVAGALAQALVSVNRPGDALALIDQEGLSTTPAEQFWKAQALAGLGRWSDALSLYNQAAAQRDFGLATEAQFGAAQMLQALRRTDEAVQKLSPLLEAKRWKGRASVRLASLYLDKGDPEKAQRILQGLKGENVAERKAQRYLKARIELRLGHAERATPYLEPLTKKPRQVTHSLLIATLSLLADCHLQLKTPETGDDFLEDFIDHHPVDPALPQIFAKLDQLYAAEKKPVRAELERWAREQEQPRRGLAQWYLARIELRAGRRDRAYQVLNALRRSGAQLPELAGGLFELAQMEMETGNPDEALAIAAEARSWRPGGELAKRFEFLAGSAEYALGHFNSASATFAQLADRSCPEAAAAQYNAALGWLELGETAKFAAVQNDSSAGSLQPQDRIELRLQEGLIKARQQQPGAADALRKFIADFPQDARASEAWVALAEMTFHQDPNQAGEARKILDRAMSGQVTPAARERAQYLMIWIEEAAGGNSDRMIELAKRFLADEPGSALTGDVRMKLAEAYYLRQDFANAQTEFELFSQNNPNSPLLEKALFFAAKSAVNSMASHALDRAITLFDQVVQMKGELRWSARNEQALIERKLGKPEQALLLYDEVLNNDARPGEKREALCGKGDIYFELSTADSKNYQRAIEAYDQLASLTPELGHWHNQALFKKGICLEKKADRGAALATLYQVLESPVRPERGSELFWFYKAGFNAARLLEADAQWDSAAKVYQKLAAVGGSRSEEAQVRLNQLRLEHFLWAE
jgi:TolA-binding protein